MPQLSLSPSPRILKYNRLVAGKIYIPLYRATLLVFRFVGRDSDTVEPVRERRYKTFVRLGKEFARDGYCSTTRDSCLEMWKLSGNFEGRNNCLFKILLSIIERQVFI